MCGVSLRTIFFAFCKIGGVFSISAKELMINEEIKAKDMLAHLFTYFVDHPEKLPIDCLETISKESVERAVCDYLSGMTDRYALDLYHEIFIPEVWRVK